MPDFKALSATAYERAVAELENDFVRQLKARPLSQNEIAAKYPNRNFVAGWRLELPIANTVQNLCVLISPEFPFAPPVIAFAAAPPVFPTFPHVEPDGVLCLLPNSAAVSPYRSSDVAKELLLQAVELIEECLSKSNADDFRAEFYSYWNRAVTGERIKFVSLLDSQPPSRLIRVWRGHAFYVFGETDAALLAWLENSFGKKNYKIEAAAFLWLFNTLPPSEYPQTNSDVYRIAINQTDNGAHLLERLAAEDTPRIPVVFGSQTDNGACFAGVIINKPQNKVYQAGNVQNLLENGFRAGKVPAQTLAVRYLKSDAVCGRFETERADAAWVHARGAADENQSKLINATVTVIGCGSIGASVAQLLAAAGVGTIQLIDPQILTRANTGRHALGARWVGASKAISLSAEIKENFPHLSTDFRCATWQHVAREEPEFISASDLIVSALGDWQAEAALNEWQQTNADFPPVLYGWTEPFAAAGHAVAIFKGYSCLQCQMSETGVPVFRATRWNIKNTLRQEPACGVVYHPYGFVELNHTITLIAETAIDVLLGAITTPIHRVWGNRCALLEASGGEWTNEWLAAANGNVAGGFSILRDWRQRPDCQSCQTKGFRCASI